MVVEPCHKQSVLHLPIIINLSTMKASSAEDARERRVNSYFLQDLSFSHFKCLAVFFLKFVKYCLVPSIQVVAMKSEICFNLLSDQSSR